MILSLIRNHVGANVSIDSSNDFTFIAHYWENKVVSKDTTLKEKKSKMILTNLQLHHILLFGQTCLFNPTTPSKPQKY
jgi:hypothetical protein